MQTGWVVLASLLYAAMLFAVAWLGDRHAGLTQRPGIRPIIYSLALAVYCSSWTFYGAVGTAARHGLGYLPIYIGPFLMFVLGWRMLERLARLARSQNIVSIADFIGSRFGRSQRLAALVTAMALISAIPYLALQYKAVVTSLGVLTGLDARRGTWGDPAFYVAIVMALFAILFGTRRADATEHRPGLMLAVALESIVKLLALVAVGVFALTWFADAPLPVGVAVWRLIQDAAPVGFTAQTLLAFAAIICLPRQFHVAIVECGEVSDIRRARWLFGMYLLVISLMVPPIAAAGLSLFGADGRVATDSFVLALPLAAGQHALALVAYIGGFSAATGMVIVLSVALSHMIGNDLVMPLLLRRRGYQAGVAPGGSVIARTDRLVLWVRRIVIVLLALLAYFYSRGMGQAAPLANFGLIAFAAVAQFAPALLAGLYWRGASRRGVEIGLLAGFGVWAYTLVLPNLAEMGWLHAPWLTGGPFGLVWLRPYSLFGDMGWDPLTHSTFWSLLINAAAMALASLRWRPSLTEQMQAQSFLAQAGAARYLPDGETEALAPASSGLRVQDLLTVAAHVAGHNTARKAFEEQARVLGRPFSTDAFADRGWVQFTELLLAGVVGASSARLVITRALQGSGMELAAIVAVLDEAGQELRFNRDILLATLEHIDPGVSVVDAEMRLVAWNPRYQQLFHYPVGMLYVGRDVADLIAHNLRHNPLGLPSKPVPPERVSAEVQRRVELMRDGQRYTYVRELRDGRFIEMRGHPLPQGGYVTSYTDITAFKSAERSLREINETLEQRVAERTREVAAAHETRSRYLTAISHDVLQPIHAARLFAAALRDEQHPGAMRHLAERVDASLGAAEELLDGVLDISRLDAGVMTPKPQRLRLQPLLQSLREQYAPLAVQRGLQWRVHAGAGGRDSWVRSDPRLLRRVLQNFVANALRYTPQGGVRMTVRRRGPHLWIQVWDTGPGIPESHLAHIYEEFHRYQQGFDWDGRGLGLGLSICQRIARLLDHPLTIRSRPGHGSVFGILVPQEETPAAAEDPTEDDDVPVSRPAGGLDGMRVLCLDNAPDILQATQTLLARWGVQTYVALNLDEATRIMTKGPPPHCFLVDYHLHDHLDGLGALDALRRIHPAAGALITADGSDRLKALADARGYPVLTKPLKPATLRAFLMAHWSAC